MLSIANNAASAFTIRGLMEDGVHYGHSISKWNPLMAEYIYCKRNGIHIIDLNKTASLLHTALEVIRGVTQKHGRILFVCTKPEAREIVEREAVRCGQYYVNTRWLGGTITNWQTVSRSIRGMDALEKELTDESIIMLKKERMKKTKKLGKMHVVFNGIKTMGNRPDLICVIGVNKDHITIAEAQKAGIPVVGIVDTDCNPLQIDYPIPGNDDSLKSIEAYMQLWSDAALRGLAESTGPKHRERHDHNNDKRNRNEEKRRDKGESEKVAEEEVESDTETDGSET